MKAFNIDQPWAELIIRGRKKIELRNKRLRRPQTSGRVRFKSLWFVLLVLRNDYSCPQLNFVPNHLVNHLKLPHSSLEAHVKQGNSFPATSIMLDIFLIIVSSLMISFA